MSRKPGPWSYSGIKTYDTCPRKYQAEKVTKEVPFKDTTATLYGKEIHTVCEEYIRDDKEIPEKHSYLRPYLERLKAIPGEKHCEIKVGVKKEDGRLVACDYGDSSVWFRGICDLAILNGSKGYIVDYKTSKNARYADMRQLYLMAAALFLKFPELEKIKLMLLFVVSKETVREEVTVERGLDIFANLHGILEQREASYQNDIWNPKPNGLCKNWCSVQCPHNGQS